MEVKAVEDKKNSLFVEIASEDHTLGNIIKDNLWKEKDIESAAYRVDHPLKGNIQIQVKSAKGDPKKILAAAASALERDAKAFKKKFSESCK